MCAPSIISWSTTTPLGATSPTSTSHPATRRIWQTQCAAWPSRTSSLSSSSGTAASIATLPWHGVGPPHRCAALGWSLAWSAIDVLQGLQREVPACHLVARTLVDRVVKDTLYRSEEHT